MKLIPRATSIPLLADDASPCFVGFPPFVINRIIMQVLHVLLGLSYASAYQLAPLRASSLVATPVVMMAKNPFKRDGSDKDTIATPETAGEAFADIDVSEAAEAISKSPKFQAPPVDWESTGKKAEKAAIDMFKVVKKAVESAIEFNEEHDVIGKAKEAAQSAIEFEKKNELFLKTRAAVELGAEAATGAMEEAKKAKPPVNKAAPKAKAKGAKPAAKPATKKAKKANPSGLPFDLPDLPKF
jgi:hypothetical protein